MPTAFCDYDGIKIRILQFNNLTLVQTGLVDIGNVENGMFNIKLAQDNEPKS